MAHTVMGIKPEIPTIDIRLSAHSIKNGLIAVLLLAVALLLMLACGPSAPESNLSAETVLEQARQAMAEVQSYRYTVETSIQNDEGTSKTHLEVEWASPGDSRVRINHDWPDGTSSQEFVTVGGRSLARSSNYGGGDWIRMDSPPGWVLPEEVFIPELEDAEVAEDETIDGRPMYHVIGRYETNGPPPEMPQVSRLSLFVDQETMLLRRQVIDSEFTIPNLADWYPGQEPGNSLQLSQHAVFDYFDYNEPVVIELPPP